MNSSSKRKKGYDIAIIGAGPAGLAAAARASFVKRHEALPLSVVILDASDPGGLLNAGGERILTGPSNTIDAAVLKAELLRDVERLEIPIIRSRITDIAHGTGGDFILQSQDAESLRATAAVVATGSRPLSNELAYLGNRVSITYKGLCFIPDIVSKARGLEGDGPVAVVTNRNARSLLDLYESALDDFLFLVPSGDEAYLEELSMHTVGYDFWHIAGNDLNGLDIDISVIGQKEKRLRVRAMILDYVSFQNFPHLPKFQFSLQERQPGIPWVDAFMRSSEPGLFFAGDVTCRYASTAAAIGDGNVAGLGAYSHAYDALFGYTPPLFAYRAGPTPENFLKQELPPLQACFTLQWLKTPPKNHPLATFDGLSFEEIINRTDLSLKELEEIVYPVVREHLLTFRPEIDPIDASEELS